MSAAFSTCRLKIIAGGQEVHGQSGSKGWVASFFRRICTGLLTQFISHRLCRREFKRFYRYHEGMLDGCKSDRYWRLMNWDIFFVYFIQFVGMRQQNNHHQNWLRQIRYLPMINRSSGHQNQQKDKTEIKKKNWSSVSSWAGKNYPQHPLNFIPVLFQSTGIWFRVSGVRIQLPSASVLTPDTWHLKPFPSQNKNDIKI